MTKKIYLGSLTNSYFHDALNGVVKYDEHDNAYLEAVWWQEYFNAVEYLWQLSDDDDNPYLDGVGDYIQGYQDYIKIAEEIRSNGESREVLAKYNDNVKAE